jgi:pyruvate dehydrogenase E2 component (dihydrolipoamide acetyltransferase)
MATPIVMPSFGMYTAEGTLAAWLLDNGATLAQGQAVAEIETEKSTYQIPAPAGGTLRQALQPGARLTEGQEIGHVLAAGEAGQASQPALQTAGATSVAAGAEVGPGGDRIKATPLARRIAKEHGIDMARLRGSGPGGRIVETDIRAAIAMATTPAPPVSAALPPVLPAVSAHAAPALPIRSRTRLSMMRLTIGERLRRAQSTAVSLTLTREVVVDGLVAAREATGRSGAARVSYDALFAKLLADALIGHPLNGMIDGDALVVYDAVNVGVAVALDDGLIVPVMRCVQAASLADVDRRVRELAERARASALRPEDLTGGTTTITNLGASGIDGFTPVLNPPQSCILGIGRLRTQVIARDGGFYPAQTCVLSLTFDHRVTDGAPAARVLAHIADRITDAAWMNALVEGRL